MITTYSKVADYYYNQQERYKEGCATDKIVFEMDKLCKQGTFEVSRDELTSIVKKKHPEMREKRVLEVIGWARSEGYIDEDKETTIITIKPI